jgi:hypothetical protein
MFRLFAPLTLIFSVVLTVALLLIHAQTNDDRNLRQVLLPEDCPAPCFMGIRPGVTTLDEALAILTATGWVDHFEYETDETSIDIKWNDSSPTWLPRNGARGDTSLWINKGLISQLNFETNLTLGTIQLSIGQIPMQRISLHYFAGRYFLLYSAVYPSKGLNISVSKNCDTQQGSITYHDKVYLHYAQVPPALDVSPDDQHPWLDVLRTACRS